MVRQINFLLYFFLSSITLVFGQKHSDITRIEFNSGTRSYREQAIFTKDSVFILKEDFTSDQAPKVQRQKCNAKQWSDLLANLESVKLSEISGLKSPTMKRAYDAAAHGSIIITTRDGQSHTHSFDDDNPHEKLQPLMKQIKKITGKEKR